MHSLIIWLLERCVPFLMHQLSYCTPPLCVPPLFLVRARLPPFQLRVCGVLNHFCSPPPLLLFDALWVCLWEGVAYIILGLGCHEIKQVHLLSDSIDSDANFITLVRTPSCSEYNFSVCLLSTYSMIVLLFLLHFEEGNAKNLRIGLRLFQVGVTAQGKKDYW